MSAFAATATVNIGGTALNSGTYYTVIDNTIAEYECEGAPSEGKGYAYLNEGTLALEDFVYTAPTTTAIDIAGDCTIKMVGESSVTVAAAANEEDSSAGALTFQGDGTLTATGGNTTGEFSSS